MNKRTPDWLLFSDPWRLGLAGILFLSLLAHVYAITAPIDDHHGWRQSQTAMITRNLYREGFNLWWPKIDWEGNGPGVLVLEFPLYNAIVALLYHLFGPKEWAGRIVSIAATGVATVFLYQIARRVWGQKAALFSVGFFCISPLTRFYGRAFMPEALMICAALGAVLFFYRWAEEGRRIHLTISALCTLIAFVVKFPMVHLGIPLAAMAIDRARRESVSRSDLLWFALVTVVPTGIWLWHSVTSPNLTMSWLFSDVTLLKDKEFYRVLWGRLGGEMLTPIGRALFLLGLILGVRSIGERAVGAWLLGGVVYLLVMGRGNFYHDYYQIPVLPIACLYAGKGMSFLTERSLVQRGGLGFRLRQLAPVLLMGIAVLQSVPTLRWWYSTWIPGLYKWAPIVRKATPPGSLILASGSLPSPGYVPWYPEVLYAYDRKGWNVPLNQLFNTLHAYRERGATHLALYPLELNDGDSRHFTAFLTQYPVVAVARPHSTGLLLDLRRRKAGEANVLVYDGFEEGLRREEWRPEGGSLSLSKHTAHSGRHSVYMKAEGSGWMLLQHRRIQIIPGTLYGASVWIKGQGPTPPVVGIYYSTYATPSSHEMLSLGDRKLSAVEGWTKIELLFVPPAEARFLLIGIGGRDARGEAWFDDFQLVQYQSD